MCITDGWCWRVFMCWFPLFYSWPACPRSAAAVSHSRMLCEMGEGVISNEKVAQAVENSLQHDYLQTTPCGATRTTLQSQWMEKWRRGRLETCADIFLLKSRDVLWIFTATLLLSVQFCDPLCQARPDVSRPLRNFFASCLTVINWDPNKRFLTWLSTPPPPGRTCPLTPESQTVNHPSSFTVDLRSLVLQWIWCSVIIQYLLSTWLRRYHKKQPEIISPISLLLSHIDVHVGVI